MLIVPMVKKAVLKIPLLQRALARVRRSFDPLPDWAGTIRNESRWWKAAYPDWAGILGKESRRWRNAVAEARGGPRVLIASTSAFPAGSIIDSLLAVALTLRGAEVHVLLCDKFLSACELSVRGFFPLPEEFVKHGPATSLCLVCSSLSRQLYRPVGLPTHRLSDFVTAEELLASRILASNIDPTEIRDYQVDGVPVGDHAFSGALRYFVRGDLEGEEHGAAVLRRYFDAAIQTAYATRRLLDSYHFSAICGIHGIYVPHGVMPAVARQRNVRSVSWSHSYRKHTFIFSAGDTYHKTMLTENASTWEQMLWTDEMELEIVDYLKSRWTGSRDWISYAENISGSKDLVGNLGVDSSKPCIGLLTNIVWDAQVNYRSNAFPNMVDWVLQTIDYFAKRPDLQLLIRVHPAEIRHGMKSRQPILSEIQRMFPELPRNVFIIPPESSISTYAVMMRCDSVLIWATKTGLELAAMGIPIVVAGEAWVRNKGFTKDASSVGDYLRILDALPVGQRLDPEMTQRARKYAYHFFFRRMIPLGFLQPSKQHIFYDLKINGLDDLMPGRSVGLDVICNGIMNGDEFIYPAESIREDFDER
jgi:hypothetical protein